MDDWPILLGGLVATALSPIAIVGIAISAAAPGSTGLRAFLVLVFSTLAGVVAFYREQENGPLLGFEPISSPLPAIVESLIAIGVVVALLRGVAAIFRRGRL